MAVPIDAMGSRITLLHRPRLVPAALRVLIDMVRSTQASAPSSILFADPFVVK